MKVITCGAAFDPSQEWWKSVASTTNHQQLMSVLKEGENYHVAIIDSVVGGVCLTKELSCFKREVPQTIFFVRFIGLCPDAILKSLLTLGIDGYLMDSPSFETVQGLYSLRSNILTVNLADGKQLLLSEKTISCDQAKIRVTATEALLLRRLILSQGRPVTSKMLQVVLGYNSIARTQTVRSHIERIRKRAYEAGFPSIIGTQPKAGYYIECPAA